MITTIRDVLFDNGEWILQKNQSLTLRWIWSQCWMKAICMLVVLNPPHSNARASICVIRSPYRSDFLQETWEGWAVSNQQEQYIRFHGLIQLEPGDQFSFLYRSWHVLQLLSGITFKLKGQQMDKESLYVIFMGTHYKMRTSSKRRKDFMHISYGETDTGFILSHFLRLSFRGTRTLQ
jgi:hypothetical protein